VTLVSREGKTQFLFRKLAMTNGLRGWTTLPTLAHWLKNHAVQNRELVLRETGSRRTIAIQNLVTPLPDTFEPQACRKDLGNHRAEAYLSGVGDFLGL
jgi:hypothetical protein